MRISDWSSDVCSSDLFTAMGAYLALGIHANTFFWGLTPGETQTVTLGLFAGLVVGAPLAAPLMRRFEKAQILAAGMAGMALAQAGPALLRLAGLLPDRKSTRLNSSH